MNFEYVGIKTTEFMAESSDETPPVPPNSTERLFRSTTFFPARPVLHAVHGKVCTLQLSFHFQRGLGWVQASLAEVWRAQRIAAEEELLLQAAMSSNAAA